MCNKLILTWNDSSRPRTVLLRTCSRKSTQCVVKKSRQNRNWNKSSSKLWSWQKRGKMKRLHSLTWKLQASSMRSVSCKPEWVRRLRTSNLGNWRQKIWSTLSTSSQCHITSATISCWWSRVTNSQRSSSSTQGNASVSGSIRRNRCLKFRAESSGKCGRRRVASGSVRSGRWTLKMVLLALLRKEYTFPLAGAAWSTK